MKAPSIIESERQRVLEVYRRRDQPASARRYSASRPSELRMRQQRVRAAASMLARVGRFPEPGQPCLEVGCGRGGWFADLLGFGLWAEDLHGIELDPARLADARRRFPGADLRVGCATALPWPDCSFHLVIASTLMSSILEPTVRAAIAREMLRVLAPGGAIVAYDFALGDPTNPDTSGCGSRALRTLFRPLTGRIRWLHLLPPLARRIERAPALVSLLELLPPLRTHRLAVFYRTSPC